MTRFKDFTALVLFATAALSACSRRDQEIRASVERMYQQKLGKDLNVASVHPIKSSEKAITAAVRLLVWDRSSSQQQERLVYLTNEAGWKAEFDLEENFEQTVFRSREVEQAAITRMAQRLSEIFRTDVKVASGLTKRFERPRVLSDGNILATFYIEWSYRKTETERVPCIWAEQYRFTDGRWELDSFRLLESLSGARRP